MSRTERTNLDHSMNERDARALVDALLNREVPIEDLGACEDAIESDRAASETLGSYRGMLDALRAPVDTPDMTSSIIQEVGRRRRWMAPSWRRIVTTSRLALAASLLAACAVVLVVQRTNPDATLFAQQPTPLNDVVRTSQHEANAGLVSVGSVLPSMSKIEAPEVPVRRLGTQRWFRMDQGMPIYRVEVGQLRKVVTIHASAPTDEVIRFEFRSGSHQWTVGCDEDSLAQDRWSVLSVNNN
ncbi:MAG: hypothetical protein ACF8GE_03800 [Phycisphaerales bacterium JB043]